MTKFAATDLMPHQKAFLNKAFAPESEKTVLLVAPPGYGKSRTFVAAVRNWHQTWTESKMLFLAPNAMHDQILELLAGSNVPAFRFDRYWLREKLDSADEDDRIPAGAVAVANPDFVKKPDVLEYVVSNGVDLVIADEAHRFHGERYDLISSLERIADKVILATGTPHDLRISLPPNTTIVNWNRSDIVDVDGNPLLVELGSIASTRLQYEPTDVEIRLQTAVDALVAMLREVQDTTRLFVASTLERTAGSSPPALESNIRSLRNYLAHPSESSTLTDFPGRDPDDLYASKFDLGRLLGSRSTSLANNHITGIELLLDMLGEDAKLDRFGELIADLRGLEIPKKVTLIVTRFTATLHYLSAFLEEKQVPHVVIHASSSSRERKEAIIQLDGDVQVLVATAAVVDEHLGLTDIGNLVAYDTTRASDLSSLMDIVGSRRDRPVRSYVLEPGLTDHNDS